MHDVEAAAKLALERRERGDLARLGKRPLPDPGAEVRTVRGDPRRVPGCRDGLEVGRLELRRAGPVAGVPDCFDLFDLFDLFDMLLLTSFPAVSFGAALRE